jgi:hypothetical protein
MTKQKIEATVREWQTRLGLDGWKIAVQYADMPGEEWAKIEPFSSYDHASLTVSVGYPNWTPAVANVTIVHELLHLLVRDIDAVVEDARSQLHPQASAQVEKRYEHEVEGFVDRLAARIVEIGGVA